MTVILALVTDAYGGTGGIALHSREILRAMAEAPEVERVHCLPRVIANALEPVPDKVVFHDRAAGGFRAYIRAIFAAVRAEKKLDLIYCCHINLAPLAWLVARLTGARWFLCLHGVEAWTPSPRRLSRWLSGHADHVIAVSHLTRSRFLDWNRIDPSRCSVIHNAIDLAGYAALPRDPALAARLGLTGRRVIMTVGRMHPVERAKGFDKVIAALPDLHAQLPDLAYLIVGSGEDRARLEALAETLGVGDAVVFAGFVPEAEKAAYYAQADAYVMPSRMEGFGYVFLEAMACGLPVVGSSTDGGRDALMEGKLGRLVDPDDRAALVGAIRWALDQPRKVPDELSYFSFDNFAAKVRKLVASLTREKVR